MNAIELNELSIKVAVALGLRAVTVNDRVRIFTGSESYFFLRDDRNRIEVNGNFHLLAKQKSGEPRSTWFGPKVSVSITVAASKSPEVIAADIKRRFLPAYDAAFIQAAGQRATNDSYFTNVANLKAEVEQAIGSASQWPVSFECGHDSAAFHVHGLKRDDALKLAAFLKTLNLEQA